MRQDIHTISKDIKMVFGWVTGLTNRNVIVGELVEYVREHIHLINHIGTLKEMLKFVKNKQGRPEAMQGEHDDLVMSLAITLAIRGQQTTHIPKAQPSIKDLPEDLQEDYRKAAPDMKKYLADKWGLKVG